MSASSPDKSELSAAVDNLHRAARELQKHVSSEKEFRRVKRGLRQLFGGGDDYREAKCTFRELIAATDCLANSPATSKKRKVGAAGDTQLSNVARLQRQLDAERKAHDATKQELKSVSHFVSTYTWFSYKTIKKHDFDYYKVIRDQARAIVNGGWGAENFVWRILDDGDIPYDGIPRDDMHAIARAVKDIFIAPKSDEEEEEEEEED